MEPGLGTRLSQQRTAAAGTAHLDAQLVPPSAIEPAGKPTEQPTRHLDPVRTLYHRVGQSGGAAVRAVHARLHFPALLAAPIGATPAGLYREVEKISLSFKMLDFT
jgi:hypothetical protein